MTDTTRLQALKDLREKVEAGSDGVVYPWHEALGDLSNFGPAAFYGSLDAAKVLHEAVLPDWCWSLDRMGQALVWYPWEEGDTPTFGAGENGSFWNKPARAWLLAILSALIAEEESK